MRQVVGLNADVIRLRIYEKTSSFNLIQTLDQGFANAMHSIHNTAVAEKNDGMRKVGIENQSRLFGDIAASHRTRAITVPISFVKLANRRQGHALTRKRR
jgi:hypothetical protein